MHRVINYGSFLQAYALKQLLLKNGADKVSFLDIKPGRILNGFEPETSWRRFKRLVKDIADGRFIFKLHNRSHQAMVRQCIESHFPLLGIDENNNIYDLVVIGSDEVFNCCQKTRWGYTTQLYGNITQAKRVISFAGSFGHTQYKQLTEHSIDEEISKYMKTMAAISVRDDNSFDIVKRLTGIEPVIHLDPVLVYGYQEEISKAESPEDKDYIVVYAYPDRIKDETEIKAICNFAKKHNKKIYSFTYYRWCDKAIVPTSPFDVLNWFKGADYVITDTFHGTIFSVITHRQFVTMIRPSNRNKICSLLKTLSLSERGTDSAKSLEGIFSTTLDYSNIDTALSKERIKAQGFLHDCIHNLRSNYQKMPD